MRGLEGMQGMRWARWLRAVYVIGFLEGTGAHAYFLASGGLHAYAYAPLPVQLLFHALLVIDPLVAVLVLRARPVGPLLGAAVMVADLVGNWWVAWPTVTVHPLAYLRPVGLLPLTLFGALVLLTAARLHRAFEAVHPGGRLRTRTTHRGGGAERWSVRVHGAGRR
ncbi:hypothetical protein GCM10009738_00050 [Kitasatospora viridis]|uniref:hypothetical protein n=1 Tax=Kitasatospora viridis TaxID=281105 RepID=UPI0031E0A7BC